MSDNLRHIIAALVTNEPGVLAQVAGMFAARGFNIDSLVVGRTENPELSRMTIVVVGNPMQFEQIKKQLQKLVPVVKVVAYSDVAHVERDLMLIQVATRTESGENRRSEIIELAEIFRAKVADVAADRVMIELSGDEDKIEALIELLRPFGIIELARTGIIAMPRGSGAPGQTMRAVRKSAQAGSAADIDPGSLPPG